MDKTVQWALAGVATFVAALLLSRKTAQEPGGGGGMATPIGPPEAVGLPVDPYAAHDPTPKGKRDLTAKPGVLAFREWVLGKWLGSQKDGSPQNIVADKDGEHGEGRAWDLMTMSTGHGQAIVDALLESEGGEPDALARRAGIMYMIWQGEMWRAYPWQGKGSGEWGPYTGPNPHTDHIHFSFGWPGALGETSLYEMIAPPTVA